MENFLLITFITQLWKRCSTQFCSKLMYYVSMMFLFFFSSRRRHTRFDCDWSSDVCSSDLGLVLPVGPRDHVQGPANAPVTLVEYGDFECPHCGRAYPIVKRIQRSMGADLRFVYRHFPLTRMHLHAEHAAEMAEAAVQQGKFWPMHDLLFENQDALEDDALVGYAERPAIVPERAAAARADGRI